MPDDILNIATKETFQARPDVPENKKLVADEVNQIVSVINTNALKLPFGLTADGGGILSDDSLVNLDIGFIKGENRFMAKDVRFKKEISDDTIYDMDGVTPFEFLPDEVLELTPNNTK